MRRVPEILLVIALLILAGTWWLFVTGRVP
jgi:hypothetical protein